MIQQEAEVKENRNGRTISILMTVAIVACSFVGIAVWQWSEHKTRGEMLKGTLAQTHGKLDERNIQLQDETEKAVTLTAEVGGLTGQVKTLAEQAVQIRTERDKAAGQVASLNKSLGAATAEARAAMVQVEALTTELEKTKALSETLMDPNVN